MRRRKFLACASALALMRAGSAPAQSPGKVYRIAILSAAVPIADMAETGHADYRAFLEELRRLGYVEGQNLALERRSAEGDRRRLPALGREAVALKPDAIFSVDNFAIRALKAATPTIPIVAVAVDPVGVGFAASLVRPGGNVTGFSVGAGWEVIGKRVELLKRAVPTASRMAALWPRGFWEGRAGEVFREAAKRAELTPVDAPLDSPVGEGEYRRAFAAMVRDRVDSLYVTAASENSVHRRLIAELAAEAKLPAIYFHREAVEVGGLMAYAIDSIDIYRRAAGYIDRILKGADPAEMPIQQPTKYELLINMKTAKALGLAIPPSLLGIADEVIE